MRQIKRVTVGTIITLSSAMASFSAAPARAANLLQWIDPFTSEGAVSVRGVVPSGSKVKGEASADISSSLLGTVTRTITATKTAGAKLQGLDALVDEIAKQLFFIAGNGVLGKALIEYGTFTPKDFTVASAADRILLDFDNLSVSSSSTLAFTFNFTDNDGTKGTLRRDFTGSVTTPQVFSLLFSDATAGGGNGVLNFNQITAFSFSIEAIGSGTFDTTLNPLGLGSSSVTSPVPPPVAPPPPAPSDSSNPYFGIVIPTSPTSPTSPTPADPADPTGPSIPEPSTVLGLIAVGAFGIGSRRNARESS